MLKSIVSPVNITRKTKKAALLQAAFNNRIYITLLIYSDIIHFH